MARPCPVCSRPNADTASKCLYCSKPLSPVSDASVPELELEPPDDDRHLVIMMPSGEPSAEAIRSFSEVTEVATYDARLILQATRPRLFRRVETEKTARELSQRLAAARFAHYVVAEREIQSLPITRARRGTFHERHLQTSTDGRELTIPYRELLLLVRGEITRERHNENKLGTLRGVSQALSPGLRLHLFNKEASVAVEVDPESFDWSLLGPDRTKSGLLNLERFLGRLREMAPGVRLDRAFDREAVVLSRAEAAEDLTPLFSESEKGYRGVVYDNALQFRFYARWRYRLERHLARSTEKRSASGRRAP